MTAKEKLKKLSLWVFLVAGGLILSVGAVLYSLDKVLRGQALEPFKLGNVPVPWLLGAGASYLEVLILLVALIIAFVVALAVRWHYYRDERDFRRKYKIPGKGAFGRDLADDLSKSKEL